MLLIIDNYDSFTYNLYQEIAPYYANIHVVRNNKITIDAIKKLPLQGIILSPGPGRPEHAGICVSLIQAYIAGNLSRVPLLGVCLGHQAIVVALGGKVKQATEIMHGKTDLIFHSQTNLYRELSSPFKAGRYHSLIAERETLPNTLMIEAENSEKMIMGVRHNTLPIFGVQFHPESILTEVGQKFLQTFVSLCLSNNEIKVA